MLLHTTWLLRLRVALSIYYLQPSPDGTGCIRSQYRPFQDENLAHLPFSNFHVDSDYVNKRSHFVDINGCYRRVRTLTAHQGLSTIYYGTRGGHPASAGIYRKKSDRPLSSCTKSLQVKFSWLWQY